MIELPEDRSTIRPWLVCESGHRWFSAVARFAPQLMPKPLLASITPAAPADVVSLSAGSARAVVLWEVDRSNLAVACDWLIETAIGRPAMLRITVGTGLSDGERLVLSELGSATTLQHPEQLPRLETMIKAHFATSSHHLDF